MCVGVIQRGTCVREDCLQGSCLSQTSFTSSAFKCINIAPGLVAGLNGLPSEREGRGMSGGIFSRPIQWKLRIQSEPSHGGRHMSRLQETQPVSFPPFATPHILSFTPQMEGRMKANTAVSKSTSTLIALKHILFSTDARHKSDDAK